jgi:hypothetical protein
VARASEIAIKGFVPGLSIVLVMSMLLSVRERKGTSAFTSAHQPNG